MNGVDLSNEIWRVWNEEGLSGLVARYDDFFTDDFEWRPPIAEMTGAPYVGREGFEQYVTDVEEILSGVRPGPFEELAEIAPDVIRSRVLMHGEGTRSGAIVDASLIGIARLRNGRIWWWWATYDPAAAERVAEAIARGEEAPV